MAIPSDEDISNAARTARYRALTQPKRSQSGTEVIEQFSADEIDKLAGSSPAAADQPHFGLRFTKLVPPGCG